MFLSNPRKSFLLITICLTFLQACGSPPVNENKVVSLDDASGRRFPFPTKEPQGYQGDFLVGNGISEEQFFVARKGDKWRVSIKLNKAPLTSQPPSHKVYFHEP